MSQHKTIADAVQVVVAAMTSAPTTVVRAEAWVTEGDTLPLIVITMDGDATKGTVFGGCTLRSYGILVSVIYASNAKLVTGIDDAAEWRQKIRRKLVGDNSTGAGTIIGVASVYDVNAQDGPAIDEAAFRGGYNVARLLLTYETSEIAHE